MRCAACGGKLIIRNNKCVACDTPAGQATSPTQNQVSEMADEIPFKCPQCGSWNIHFCFKNNSLRCKKCKKLMSYDEAILWHR